VATKEQREAELLSAVKPLTAKYSAQIPSMARFLDYSGDIQLMADTSIPDIASISGLTPPQILFGWEWVNVTKMRPDANGDKDRERMKRIMHEMIHIVYGRPHNADSRRLGFYSNPMKDTLTWDVFKSWEKKKGSSGSRGLKYVFGK
jgi:hypothetical protein